MRSTTKRISMGLLALVLCAALGSTACAAQRPGTAMRKQLQEFQLTEAFLNKYLAVQEDIAKDPCNLSIISLRGNSSDNGFKTWANNPDVRAMLASHDLTPKQYMVGYMALMVAGMQSMARKHPDADIHIGIKVSDENVAFFRKHHQQIKQHNRSLHVNYAACATAS